MRLYERLKFTGKERDQESGLDYFGARYYGSALGRFTSPDWSEKPQPVPYADLENPQTLNLYTYGHNNPLTVTDPNGHCTSDGQQKGFWWCLFNDSDQDKQDRERAAARQAEYQGHRRRIIREYGYDPELVAGQIAMAMAGPLGGELEAEIAALSSAETNGALTVAEKAEIQAIADKYHTEIDVVGSRAAGTGRNVETNLPVGKGANGRSDIDFPIDASHPQLKDLIKDLKAVGGGAGSASTKYSTADRPTQPPLIRFTPKK